MFLKDLEVTGQAFEDMQEQNIRLLQQLREKDDANFKLMSEVSREWEFVRVLLFVLTSQGPFFMTLLPLSVTGKLIFWKLLYCMHSDICLQIFIYTIVCCVTC